MDTRRITRTARMSAVLVVLALGLGALVLALTASPAHAAGLGAQSSTEVVKFGKDVFIGPNQDVKTAVAFGGDITVAGTVEQSVVAFGGDIRLLPSAVVGGGMNANDTTVVSFGGSITRAPGAQVTGQTKALDSRNWAGAVGSLGSSQWHTWFGWSPVGWIVQTAVFLVLGLVAAALMPRQLQAVQRTLGQRPGASLGWGALTFFVIVPVTFVVLVVSIIGILLAIPLGVFVALAYFFVITGVAALLAEKVLSSGGRQSNLMLAVAVGVVGTTIVSRIPVAGGLALLAMMVFGAGAGVLAFGEWRRGRRLAPAPTGAPQGPGGQDGYPGAPEPPAAPDDTEGLPDRPDELRPGVAGAAQTWAPDASQLPALSSHAVPRTPSAEE